jgi:uncharacterized protein DUF4255/carboxypeptidase family protein
MLAAIHDTIATLLYEKGRIDPNDVDVSFEMPRDEWVRSLTRPTINLFLFEVAENMEKRETSPYTNISSGRAERRLPARRIDLSYMVSVLTTEVEDEHEVLWRVLQTLMRYQQFPQETLADALRSVTPPITTRIAVKDDVRGFSELWTALDTRPHPALAYVLTAPMDLAIAIEAPLVLTRTARYRRMAGDSSGRHEVVIQIGGFVRDAKGRPLANVLVHPDDSSQRSMTDADGRFVLHGVREGQIAVTVGRPGETERHVSLRVPGESYDIVLDREA